MGETSRAAHQRNIERLIERIYAAPDGDRRRRLIALLHEEEAAGRERHGGEAEPGRRDPARRSP